MSEIATDGSNADVIAKLATAVLGDIVTIPEGDYGYDTPISFGDGIHLRGAGSGRVIGRSNDSVTFGTGAKVFTVQPEKTTPGGYVFPAFSASVGQTLRIWVRSTDKDTAYMLGTVTSVVGTALTMDIVTSTGSGTARPWLIATEPMVTISHNAGASDLIVMGEDTVRSTELSGIHFKRGTGSGAFIRWDSVVGGVPVLIHDLWTNINSNGETLRTLSNRAVLYNISGTATFFASSAALFLHNPYGAFGFDTTAWDRLSDWGADDSGGRGKIYVENCDFHGWLGLSDSGDNAKVVFRRNVFNAAAVNSHGRDTGDVGLRSIEYYDNWAVFHNLGTDTPNLQNFLSFRGGSGVIMDNIMVDIASGEWGAKPEIQLQVLALSETTPGFGWGYGDGGDPDWPAPRQVGTGNTTGATTPTENGYFFGQPEAIYISGNVDEAGDPFTPSVSLQGAVNGADPDDVADYVQAGREYFNDGTAKPGFVKFEAPHPLRAEAASDPSSDEASVTLFRWLTRDEQDREIYEALGGDGSCWFGMSREERRQALYEAAGGTEQCFLGRSREEQEKLFYEALYASASSTDDLVDPSCFNGLSPELKEYNIFAAASLST